MDPIADMINSIKNALAVKKTEVLTPFSKFKFQIATILAREGWIKKVEKTIEKTKTKKIILKPCIRITLKYINNLPAISGIRKISKQGQRIYSSFKSLKKIRGGYGMSIISSSKGILTSKEARKLKVGGEIILEVW